MCKDRVFVTPLSIGSQFYSLPQSPTACNYSFESFVAVQLDLDNQTQKLDLPQAIKPTGFHCPC